MGAAAYRFNYENPDPKQFAWSRQQKGSPELSFRLININNN
jgi:hypothetical protein